MSHSYPDPIHNAELILELAHALNEIHDLKLLAEELQGWFAAAVRDKNVLEEQWDTHDCEDSWDYDAEHDDCVEQEDHDRIVLHLEAKAEIYSRAKDKREELWWQRQRLPMKGGHTYDDLTDQIALLDELLENPR